MRILVTAATETELLTNSAIQADLLCTGVGAAHTAYQLMKALSVKKYDWVLQIGICGVFPERPFELGDVVYVQKDCFADIGAWNKDGFDNLVDMGFMQANSTVYRAGWLENTFEMKPGSDLTSVKGITVNSIHEDRKFNQILAKKYDADIESLEGAALHYVCLQEGIPFIQIRSISNWVGERNKQKWKIQEAIQNLHRQTEQVLTSLIQS